jgi:hypothetical protein
MTNGRRLVRAAVTGLALALAVGAIVLVGAAVRRLQVDCTDRGPEECTFETSLASSIARQQALAALGMGSLAAGVVLLLRRRSSP